jgi:hypothetical protein
LSRLFRSPCIRGIPYAEAHVPAAEVLGICILRDRVHEGTTILLRPIIMCIDPFDIPIDCTSELLNHSKPRNLILALLSFPEDSFVSYPDRQLDLVEVFYERNGILS